MHKIIKIIISLVLFWIAFFIKFNNPWVTNLLYISSYLFVGLDIILKACQNIWKGKVFDENFLMVIATIGAFLIHERAEAIFVMLFYQIGEFLQDKAVCKAKKSIADLMDIRPSYANLEKEGRIKRINPNEVKVNDIIVIKPGEKVPLDGVVVEGCSSIDKKSLTGEAMPEDVKAFDEVLSGSINLNGLLKVKVTKEYKDSTVYKILSLVDDARRKKSKSENFITKFAHYYTPIVVILACIMALVLPIFTPENFYQSIYKALSFLVVSCPCALVVSIPLSFFAGLGGASKRGILFKDSNCIEKLDQLDTIVFDKTGTLTKGIFVVQKVVPFGIKESELLKYAAMLEYYASHPIAMALKNAYQKPIQEKEIKKVSELPGYGIKAQVEGHTCLIGNEKLMLENKIKFVKSDAVGTILYVALDKKYVGYILIADEIKQESIELIRELNEKNIKKIIMLTGDSQEVGLDVAQKLAIKKVYTDLLPQDKVKIVEDLIKNERDKKIVAYVGDGINDAPVLAVADLGIAMGKVGSDSAIEAADVVIMDDNPKKIMQSIKLAHKTMKIVKENIIFAITVKVVILLLTALGISSMWEAVFADVGVSLIAILNALRTIKG